MKKLDQVTPTDFFELIFILPLPKQSTCIGTHMHLPCLVFPCVSCFYIPLVLFPFWLDSERTSPSSVHTISGTLQVLLIYQVCLRFSPE